MIDDKKEFVKKFVLQNGSFFDGPINVGSVMGKIISQEPDFKSNIPELKETIINVSKEINSLSKEERKKELEKIAPELLVKEKKEEGGLSELSGAEEGKVVTRFAPSPTGPLTLGQFLRAVMLSYAYAKKYNGKFILRIEDTDSKKIKLEFIKWMKEDLRRCGIEPDQIVHQSERMEIYYDHVGKLIEGGKAYVCTCSAEAFRGLKNQLEDCQCRKKTLQENKDEWKKMKEGTFSDGEAVLRLKTSMQDKNPVMRDPPIFRVNKGSHPLQGIKYNAWPLYNLSCAVDDYKLGITHVFRGKEHEHNTSVQNVIYDFFKWKKPVVLNFGMISFPGTVQHSREMRELVDSGKATGWDDPKLPTIRALLRRGFAPEALKSFALSCGLSKNDIQSSWENLEAANKKIIDPIANRYMIVKDPVRIPIKNAPEISFIEEPLHPDKPEKKKIPVDLESVFISGDDFKKLKGKNVRLKGLFNIKLDIVSEYSGNEITREMPKIQWVSVPNVNVNIIYPGKTEEAIGENSMKNLSVNDIIQMERVGFGRIDKKEEMIDIVFGHK
ncbi:MAG: glutamate--tRNA ligase [Candidatus Aenigmarchaeota archaeon]|nr:glutamate--tRNA ligase [Candidatus Aenigmarchaeota archaeon]